MMVKSVAIGVVCALCTLLHSEIPAPQTETLSSPTEKAPVELLFVMFAADAHVQPSALDPKAGTLTLYKVSKHIFFFSDRPNRKAGKKALSTFLSLWDHGRNNFKQDHPNAGVVANMITKNSEFSDIFVTLSDPYYDAENDRLTFKITALENTTIQAGDFGETALFIDALMAKF